MKEIEKVLSSYIITNKTMALYPANHSDYDTLVYDVDAVYGVRQTVTMIIDNSCRQYCSDMHSRRRYVSDLTQVHKKVPLLIDETNAIFTFPTHSPTDLRCVWLAFHHVSTYVPDEHDPNITIVKTYSNRTLTVTISYNTFKKQITRTGYGVAKFQDRFKFQSKRGISSDDETDED
ncbi:competence protein ComK [Salisediminibacterium halotolerans]|uniref:Competence protein ComK n=1 Tax=Salisediminibacterium halotolerans TaxID=517425 RepID=A0A1H9QH41_9BACI|nr:competence protein ComK [Salisediminibacterium haloalkalitolerans]SER59740.1 competence protein ComK [Salisediminibacterium haloalkalitolerans]